MSRTAEDYAVVYMGAAVFKITRLLVIAISCVHVFACIFYKVKSISAASPEDVTEFYTSRGIHENVQNCIVFLPNSLNSDFDFDVTGSCKSIREEHVDCSLYINYPYPTCLQLVCFYYVFTTFTTVGYGNI